MCKQENKSVRICLNCFMHSHDNKDTCVKCGAHMIEECVPTTKEELCIPPEEAITASITLK